jgi:hypothetical protein
MIVLKRLNRVKSVVRFVVVMWLLTACGDDVISSGSSSTVANQTGGLPMGGPEIPGAPEPVATREPLPYCGAEVIGFSDGNPYEFIELVQGASECYRSRATLS